MEEEGKGQIILNFVIHGKEFGYYMYNGKLLELLSKGVTLIYNTKFNPSESYVENRL